jgi:hypothetical protein
VYPTGGVPLFQWILLLPLSDVAGRVTLFGVMDTYYRFTVLCSGYNEMWLGRRVHGFQSIYL